MPPATKVLPSICCVKRTKKPLTDELFFSPSFSSFSPFFHFFPTITTTTTTSADGQRQNLPDLSETSSKPIRVQVGDDINIDCVVKNRNNLTILWKYVNGTQDTLISANMVQ